MFHWCVLDVNQNTENCYWNTNNPLLMRLHSLRSGKILRLLIHRDLPTSVVFVAGISSSLRPVLLWREQALLMLLTELIRPSIYLSLSPSLSLVLPVLSLAHSLWHIQYNSAHTRGVMFSWLNMIDSVNKALKNSNTLTVAKQQL